MSFDPFAAQRELEVLLAERSRLSARGEGTSALEARITTVARGLGLDPAELAGVELPADEGPLVGELVVQRRMRDFFYLPVVLVSSWIVGALGQIAIGLAMGGAVIGAFFLLDSRRVARLRIDEDGELSIPGRVDRLDWSTVAEIEVAYRYPFASRGLERAAGATLHVQLRFTDGTVITLSRGALFRLSPRRGPIVLRDLEQWLATRAAGAGMTLEQASEGWIGRAAGLRPGQRPRERSGERPRKMR